LKIEEDFQMNECGYLSSSLSNDSPKNNFKEIKYKANKKNTPERKNTSEIKKQKKLI
jgi:hypothetical protein